MHTPCGLWPIKQALGHPGYLSATALDLFFFLLWPHFLSNSSVSLTSDLFDSVSPLWPLP